MMHFFNHTHMQGFLKAVVKIKEIGAGKQEIDLSIALIIKAWIQHLDILPNKKILLEDCKKIVSNAYDLADDESLSDHEIKKINEWIILGCAAKSIAQYEKETLTAPQSSEDMMRKTRKPLNPCAFLNSLIPDKKILTRRSSESRYLVAEIAIILKNNAISDESKAQQIIERIRSNPAGTRFTRILRENNLLDAETRSAPMSLR